MKSSMASLAALALLVCVGGVQADHHAGAAEGRDADDTGRNVRDRAGDTKTPMDQGESKADRDLTASIRRSIVDDDALSTNAHNVKIVTQDGIVTLRGPVESESEKQAVVAKAARAPGVKRVENQLEVERD